MSTDIYHTIETAASAEYKEKGSKFLAFSFPVEDERQIKEIIQTFKKKYYDASHVCSGYIIGTRQRTMKGNDDGEPAHTAGTPILNQIRSRNLTNILVLVVRYFGGTKLGVSGLIEAYKEAAKECLDQVVVVEKYVCNTIQLVFAAGIQGEVMRIVKEAGAKIRSQDYENEVILIIEVRASVTEGFLAKNIQGLRMELMD